MLQVTHESLRPYNRSNTSYEAETNSTNESNSSYYLTVYAVFAGVNSVFTLFRAFLFAYGGVHAATNIHSQLLKTIMKVNTIMLPYVANKTVTTLRLWELLTLILGVECDSDIYCV
jgi:hypothetical protein